MYTIIIKIYRIGVYLDAGSGITNGIESAFRFISLNSISPNFKSSMPSAARVKIDSFDFRQAFLAAIAIFAQCIVIVVPNGGMPNNINEIYTSMKSTFSELQFSR